MKIAAITTLLAVTSALKIATTPMVESHKQLAVIENVKVLFRKPKLVLRMVKFDLHGAKYKHLPGKDWTLESCANACNQEAWCENIIFGFETK